MMTTSFVTSSHTPRPSLQSSVAMLQKMIMTRRVQWLKLPSFLSSANSPTHLIIQAAAPGSAAMETEVRGDGRGVRDDVIKDVVVIFEVVVHIQHLRRQTSHRFPVMELKKRKRDHLQFIEVGRRYWLLVLRPVWNLHEPVQTTFPVCLDNVVC